jgi:glycosyltransferase involved in cell wall biosynthesis
MMRRAGSGRSPELSAVVLCYRAAESIIDVVQPLRQSLDDLEIDYEMVLVANTWRGDVDPTPGIVKSWAAGQDNVVVLAEDKQGAMGWDMRSGLRTARGAFVIVIDGDAQNPVSDVARMYREMTSNHADVMKGRRVIRHDGAKRRIISVGYNVIFRVMFGTWELWDINGKPKGLTRAALEKMTLRSDDWFVDAELVLEARRLGLTIAEMPVTFNENAQRASFVRISSIIEFVRNMIRRRLAPFLSD